MAQAERYYDILEKYIVSGPDAKNEYRARCPLHGAGGPGTEKRPSCSFNFVKGDWHCKTCQTGGSLRALVKRINGEAPLDYNPFADIVDIDTARRRKRGEQIEQLTEAIAKGFHDNLLEDEDLLDEFIDRRGIELDVIERYQIGWEPARQKGDPLGSGRRFTIPIRDADGRLVNVRRYKPDAAASEKMLHWTGHGSPARLFPVDQLQYDELLVVEGELDALICIQHGLHAVSGTGGSGVWLNEWGELFAGKKVYVCYDNDKEGRTGGKKVTRSLARHAASVVQLPAMVPKAKGDATDYFLHGGTAEALMQTLHALENRQEDLKDTGVVTPTDIQVIGSMDSTTNGKPLSMTVTVIGKKDPTYSVPHKVELSCTLDAGPKCKVCPMFLEHEGDTTLTIDKNDVGDVSRFLDVNEDRRVDVLRKIIGAQKCGRLSADITEAITVEELYVTSSVDMRSAEGNDYTQRRVYNVGTHDTITNTVANVVGTTWPSPKDGRNEFFSWSLKEATTSIDAFTPDKAMVKRLSVFRPARGESPIAKCHDIAKDLAANVTHIYGRERMHVAFDLVWHSALHFPFDGKTISRGWLEFLVVGDTRTGKSETAIRMADHYGLGHVIGCEGATFAGLVGAVKQIGNDWTVTWGEITINDRRLVVLDEASGLAQETIGQLSDIRSRGIAQLTKVESQQTRARCRAIWISNPRKSKGANERRIDGVDIIEDLIGNPEDIARFDFAMSVRDTDVPGSKINNPDTRPVVPHVYTADLCHELILWCWSRKTEDVVWKPEAERAVYTAAEWLGTTYIPSPPLIQRAQVREKIARLSVALAMRTFSTDDSGQRVIVEHEHVKDAAEFLDKLYSYDNFGYLRISRRHRRNRDTARKNKATTKKWLREHPRLLEFLMDRRGSFRAQDLEELAFMQRDEVNMVLSQLSKAKMISKDKSQIVMEQELQQLLKEIEDA